MEGGSTSCFGSFPGRPCQPWPRFETLESECWRASGSSLTE
jgi:hypothetical protein